MFLYILSGSKIGKTDHHFIGLIKIINAFTVNIHGVPKVRYDISPRCLTWATKITFVVLIDHYL